MKGKENNGGFSSRNSQLLLKREELEIVFELFLFPNNGDNGDFETLLENIVSDDHRDMLNCFDNYEECLRQFSDDDGNLRYSLPIKKSKIYAYLDAFPKSRREKGQLKKGNFFFEERRYWNLDSEYLTPLREFLEQNLEV